MAGATLYEVTPIIGGYTGCITSVFRHAVQSPPLTTEQLRAIRERQPNNPDVIALLWEIKRMRSMLLRLNQVSGDLKRPASIVGEIYDDLMAALAVEPCVVEFKQTTAELLEDPRKLRKGMGPR